jgi:hypothetical protein
MLLCKCSSFSSTNDRNDELFQAMQRANNAQMIEQRRINDRNDERFQAMQRANNALETGFSDWIHVRIWKQTKLHLETIFLVCRHVSML